MNWVFYAMNGYLAAKKFSSLKDLRGKFRVKTSLILVNVFNRKLLGNDFSLPSSPI